MLWPEESSDVSLVRRRPPRGGRVAMGAVATCRPILKVKRPPEASRTSALMTSGLAAPRAAAVATAEAVAAITVRAASSCPWPSY